VHQGAVALRFFEFPNMIKANNTVVIDSQANCAPIAARFGALLAMVFLFDMVTGAEAAIVSIDVPGAGTNISYIQDFSVMDPVEGTSMEGQTQSLNVFVANNDFLVFAGDTVFTMNLFINQSGYIGAIPANGYTVTGYLIDAAGDPLSSPVTFAASGTIPGQFWPNWPYYLPDGVPYLPPTELFEAQFACARVYGNPNGYYDNPIIFSGVHFDITYPNSPATVVIGGRIVIANFAFPILNSPYPVPVYSQYLVYIPNPALALTRTSQGSGGTGNTSQFNLQLNGTPYYPYVLESTTNLAGAINWQTLITNSADSNGNWSITITNPCPPAEFFQVVPWSGPVHP
jgi:hypothetical protein